jgi:GNAT superfamily N-acetyltransferase
MVRTALPRDARAIEELWCELIREQESLDERLRYAKDALARFRNDLEGWLSGMGKHFWVAEVDDKVVGFVSAELGRLPVMFEAATEVYVAELFILPDYRGAGLGSSLLDQVRRWGIEHGATSLSASVLSANDKGRAFWHKQGVATFFETVRAPLEKSDATAGSREATSRPGLGFNAV